MPVADLSDANFTAEMLVAIEAGAQVEHYLGARSSGLSHREIMSAIDARYPLAEYAQARAMSVSDEQFSEMVELLRARESTRRGPLTWEAQMYIRALAAGIYHEEYCEGLRSCCDMSSYVMARQAGATSAEILIVASAEHGHLSSYAVARQSGATHCEYVDAVEYSVSLPDYARKRSAGHSHSEAITLVTPHRPTPLRIVRYPVPGISLLPH